MTNCQCINCLTKNRWEEVLYKPYLKDGGDKKFIKDLRERDNRLLTCFNEFNPVLEGDRGGDTQEDYI